MTKGEENAINEWVQTGGKSARLTPTSVNVNNPYNEITYSQTLWDKIVSGLGGRSTYDKMEAERLQNKANWDSQYSLLKEQQEYDSAEEQAKRERDAGINPNLAANVDAGDSNSDAAPSAPLSSANEMFADVDTTLQEVGKGIETAVMFAFQLAGTGQSLALGAQNIESVKIANDAKTMDVVNHMDETAESWIVKYLNEYLNSGQDFYVQDENGNWYADPDKSSSAIRYRQEMALRNQFFEQSKDLLDAIPKRFRRDMENRLYHMYNSVYGKVIRARGVNDMADVAPKRAVAQRILDGFDDENDVNDFKPISKFAVDMSDTLFKCETMRADLEKKVIDMQMSGADTQKMESEAQKGMAKIREYLNNEMQSSVEKLLEVRDSGNPLEQLGASIAIFSLCGMNFSGSADFGLSGILGNTAKSAKLIKGLF